MITNITEADVESVLNVDDLDNALFPLPLPGPHVAVLRSVLRQKD